MVRMLTGWVLMGSVILGQMLPTGFADEVVAAGLTTPVGLDLLPDGRVIVVEQDTATVKVVAGGAVGTLGSLTNVTVSYSRGLMSVAVDPQWPTRPYLYAFYAHASPASMRIVLLPVSGDLGDGASTNLVLGTPYDVLVDIPDASVIHNAGALRFGPDGMLYASMGEDDVPCDAPEPSALRGKVLRMDVSALPQPGTGPPPKSVLIPAGNPYAGPDDNARLVWCSGLRNPFRFHVDPQTGALFIADVGPDDFDEIDHAPTGGLDFGWPWFEANAVYSTCSGAMPASAAPIAARALGFNAGALISVALYRNRDGGALNFGAGYDGSYLYADYYAGHVWRLAFDGSAWTPLAAPGQPGAVWASGMPNLVDAAIGPDGALYWIQQPPFGSGSVRRIVPTGRQLSVVGGDGQAGNAGQPLHAPLQVQLLDAEGNPVPGVPVTFSISAGAGSFDDAAPLTDAAGIANATFTPDLSPPGIGVVIDAVAAAAGPAQFTVVWRGLSASFDPPTGTLAATVWHSEAGAPLTLVFDLPQPAAVATPFGPVWTSVLASSPSAVGFDGLGLLGAPDPLVVTGTGGIWSLALPGLPSLGGLSLTVQAYAIDSARLPGLEAVLVSNAVTVVL